MRALRGSEAVCNCIFELLRFRAAGYGKAAGNVFNAGRIAPSSPALAQKRSALDDSCAHTHFVPSACRCDTALHPGPT